METNPVSVSRQSFCQVDQATLRCGVQHLLSQPDSQIVAEFEPFISLDVDDLNRLMRCLAEESAQTVPVSNMASDLITSSRRMATVLLPVAYGDCRLIRVDVSSDCQREASLEACEAVIAILRDDNGYHILPSIDELDVVCIDSFIERMGNRLQCVWRQDEQLSIPESSVFNNRVEVLPASVQDKGWKKVVSLVHPDETFGRYVVEADSDGDAIALVTGFLSQRYPGIREQLSARVVFVDPVIQSDGQVFVVHV